MKLKVTENLKTQNTKAWLIFLWGKVEITLSNMSVIESHNSNKGWNIVGHLYRGQCSQLYYPSTMFSVIAPLLRLRHHKLKICFGVDLCGNCLLAGVSTHACRAWQVHYFDCRLTICLYDRRPCSLAIDGRETHRSITLRPPAAFKSSPVHTWTCWVLLDRIGYWLCGS